MECKMECNKTIGIVLLILGAVILVLFLVADIIGLGGSHGFGPTQIVGTIVGAIVTAIGLALKCKK